MKPARIPAIASVVTAASTTGSLFNVGEASEKTCPVPTTSATGESRAAARPVTVDYRTIQAASRAAGVTMTSDRQVVAVMVYPTFVDTRVAATNNACQIIGALADTAGATPNAKGRAPFVWTPPLPTKLDPKGFGARFVTSTRGSITIELRATSDAEWHRYVATSVSMRWTSGS